MFLILLDTNIPNISSLKMNLNRLEMHLDEKSKRETQIAHFKLLVRHISCHEMDATYSRVSIYTSPIGTQARAAVLLCPIKGTQDQVWTVAK